MCISLSRGDRTSRYDRTYIIAKVSLSSRVRQDMWKNMYNASQNYVEDLLVVQG
jgi:hypothetical protein